MTVFVNRAKLFVSASCGLIFLSACAWTPHDITLAPQTLPAQSEAGKGTSVYFRFVDERDDTTVGHRSTGPIGAKISAANLTETVENSLRSALIKKQYQIIDNEAQADAVIIFRLRAFKFYIGEDFWTGKKNVSAVISVDAHRGAKSYSNVYRYNSSDRTIFVPGGKDIDAQMNDALEQILDAELVDKNLDAALTGR